jgi:hypothetical protein
MNFLKATIDRFEGETAVIKTENGQEILWPKNNLPPDAKESSAIRLNLSTSKTDEEERAKLAKTLLNEILQTKKEDGQK